MSVFCAKVVHHPLKCIGFLVKNARMSSDFGSRLALVSRRNALESSTDGQVLGNAQPGLYIVGTPIGNLQDISKRALDTLNCVDKVLCEDTRRTRALLNHFGIKVRTESFHLHNEYERTEALLDELMRGQAIALVSDAGMPGINDPGGHIIARAAQANVKIIPIPGPSAFLTALVASGLLHESFVYCGFIASKSGERKRQFQKYRIIESSALVFYVSPHALVESLHDAMEEFGSDRKCCLARELTKLHEEFIRCTLAEAYEEFQQRKPRGEFTLIISGSESGQEEITDETINRALSLEIKQGCSHSMAAKIVSKSLGISRKRVYSLSLELK